MKLFKVILAALTLGSCNMSDSAEDIGGGYKFCHESSQSNFILGGDREIPANVVAYGTSDEFIIVQQAHQVGDLDDHIVYPSDDSIFYWIVSHKKHLVLGPLTKEQYENKRLELQIPETLKLEEVEY